jgi:hypothetical protein
MGLGTSALLAESWRECCTAVDGESVPEAEVATECSRMTLDGVAALTLARILFVTSRGERKLRRQTRSALNKAAPRGELHR